MIFSELSLLCSGIKQLSALAIAEPNGLNLSNQVRSLACMLCAWEKMAIASACMAVSANALHHPGLPFCDLQVPAAGIMAGTGDISITSIHSI